MSFIGRTEERNISTNGKTYKIFITEQVGGYWVATVLYADNGTVKAHNELANTKTDAYNQASTFVLNNIDVNATIDRLL